MKEKLKNMIKKYKIIFIALISLITGFLVELNGNMAVLRSGQEKGEVFFDLSQVELNGFSYEDGKLVMDRDTFVSTDTLSSADLNEAWMYYPSITINKNNSYVNKLKYSFTSEGSVEAVIYVKTGVDENGKNIYSLSSDANNQYLRTSVHKIYSSSDCIMIVFTKAENLVIEDISAYNELVFNWRRFVAVCSAVFLILLILTSSSWIKDKPENIFLIVTLLIGLSYIVVMPQQKVSWDECYHFEKAYSLLPHKNVGEFVFTYMDDTKVWPLNYPQTYEEYAYQNEYLSKMAEGTDSVSAEISLSNIVGYFAPALGIGIGSLLNLPFASVYALGKVFNLILYAVVVFFAIKRMSVGKSLMTLLALLPTPLFMASVYNRDSVIIAFAFLGFAYMFSEFYEKDKKITWKSYIIFVVSMFIAGLLKAVYAPMLLMLLFLPSDKFKDRKTKYIMKGGIIAICILLIAVLIMPTVLNPSDSGDSRGYAAAGGATDTKISAKGQIENILSNPLSYAVLLIKNIADTFLSYTMGSEAWGVLGHYGTGYYAGFILPMVLFVVLTNDTDKRGEIKVSRRLLIFLLIAISVAFVWTSMYVAFTPVGYGTILGVQGRYYIPLMLPFFMLFGTKKLINNIDKGVYNKIIFTYAVILNYIMLYMNIIRVYCT